MTDEKEATNAVSINLTKLDREIHVAISSKDLKTKECIKEVKKMFDDAWSKGD